MLISSWLKSFRNHLQSRPRRVTRRVERASKQAENLESRTLLTSPMFQGAMLPAGAAFPENTVLQTTPAQVTLQFDATQVMDLSTVNATTLVVDAAGGDGMFDTADDLSVTLTGFGVNPLPNQNLVSFQFGQQLLTDQYRLTMEGDGLDVGGASVTAMANVGGEAINDGADQTFFFDVDLPDPTLIAVLPNEGTFINVDPALPTTTLDVPPNELTLQFNPGQIIDPATVNVNTIQVQRAGHDGQFAEGNEVPVTIGYVGIGDTPEEVIVRFAENLIDDTYRITLDGASSAPLANVQGEVFNGSQDFSFDLTLDLGARVVAVDPQPVTRMLDGSLSQARDKIVVYFNEDQLDPVAAINTDFYQLIFTNDTVSNADDVHHSPTVVVYDSVTNTATLTFAADIDLLNNPGLPSSGTYRLRIGNDEVKPLAPTQFTPGTDPGSSFDTANATLGDISDPVANSQIINSSIDPQLFPFEFPGANDEPGHRQIEVETHLNGGADTGASGISKINYNFKIDYGFDPQGNALSNLITENEKQRAREIFDLYSNLLGIDFTETDSSGLTIVTGDLRALDPAIPTGPGGVAGLAGGTMAIMDMAENWTDNTGGNWFETALHEIGHLLGLGHSYELPPETVQGADGGINAGRDVFVEPSFPGDADVIHGRHLHRLDSIDIDMYEFDVMDAGLFSAEVMAERLADSSTLDSVLRLYRDNPDGTRELIAQNDDYFSEDSFIELALEPLVPTLLSPDPHYYLGVSSTGNDAYDPTIANTGLNGSSDGPYQIRTNFRPNVDNTIIDSTGVAFDGDSDGVAGGVYNFWFRAAATVDTLFVDKAAASHLLTAIDSTQTDLPFQHVTTFSVGDGILIDSEVMTITAINTTTNVVTVTRGVPAAHSLGSVIRNTASDGQLLTPFGVIDDAIQASGPGDIDIIRIVGNGGLDGMESTIDDNLSYQIGFDNSNQILEDGRELEVPQGVTVMIDAGAVFKLQKSRVGVGSSSSIVDRSRGALQVLGTPGRDVIFTSWLDESIGTDTSLGTPTSPDIGNWGGLVFRNDTDRAQNRFNYQTEGIFLNYVAHSDIRYGGGQVVVDNTLQTVNPIHITRAQPTIVHNRITMNEDSAMSADPDSFEEVTFNTPRYQGGLTAFTSDYKRVGPDIYGNTLLDNSTNGLFVRVQT
ncbi:MAG: matrixin family metalloprotease, partial [Fuerstiella sp.]|nr:matrixin family metalloprotease [Fuerstiella sp.]